LKTHQAVEFHRLDTAGHVDAKILVHKVIHGFACAVMPYSGAVQPSVISFILIGPIRPSKSWSWHQILDVAVSVATLNFIQLADQYFVCSLG
jgi:hypothetical protein